LTVLNLENTHRLEGNYPLFLGQECGLHDSINVSYPKLFQLYKQLKAQDWSEDEVDLSQTRLDLENCSNNQYDIMVKTLAWQWELDSAASRAIAPLLAPFVSNSEYWTGISYISQNEVLHALTYSEIVRQCVKNPEDVFNEIINNENITGRSTQIALVFNELQQAGAKLILGILDRDSDEAKEIVIKAILALYCLEQLQFMSSFACTFALAEQDLFLGSAKLVQKIMLDEKNHAAYGKETLKILSADKRFSGVCNKLIKEWFPTLFAECVEQEHLWADYIFSEGRSILGLTPTILKEWANYQATTIAGNVGIEFEHKLYENPLPWMDYWMDIDKTQVANQETDNTNYLLNSVINDLTDEDLDF